MPNLNEPFEYAGYTMRYNKIPLQEGTGHIHEIYIYDSITERGSFNYETWRFDESETSAKHFTKLLAEIPESDEIVCYMNSNGGEVKEGVAIYNQLKRHKAHKTVYVDGFANSVASLICMAFDKIVMGLGTSMLIHEMWLCISGNAAQLRKAADDLDDLMESNRQVYLERSNGRISEEELRVLMSNEKFLTPEECIGYGFADEIAHTKQADLSQMKKMLDTVNEQYAYAIHQREKLVSALNIMQPVPHEEVPEDQEDIPVPEPEEQPKNYSFLESLSKLF